MKLLICTVILALVGASLQHPPPDSSEESLEESSEEILHILERMTMKLRAEEQKRNEPGVDEIIAKIEERSINSGRAQSNVLGEVLDKYFLAQIHNRATRGGACNGNPCHNGGTCFTDGDLPEGQDFGCYQCDAPYSGLTCDVENACTTNPCTKSSEFCLEANAKAEGRYCIDFGRRMMIL